MFDGFFAALIAVIGVYAGLKYNYDEKYNETITKTRIDTVNNLKERIARIIAMCKNGINDKMKLYEDIYYVRICMSIHPEKEGNELHIPLCNELNKVLCQLNENCKIESEIIENIEEISKHIFDYEWNRIKKETEKGGVL